MWNISMIIFRSDIEKAWVSVPVTHPIFREPSEARVIETSNAEPTLGYIYTIPVLTKSKYRKGNIPHRHLPLHCLLMTFEISDVPKDQRQALSKRFPKCLYPVFGPITWDADGMHPQI